MEQLNKLIHDYGTQGIELFIGFVLDKGSRKESETKLAKEMLARLTEALTEVRLKKDE